MERIDAGLALMLTMSSMISTTRERAILELTLGCFLLRNHRLLFAVLALYHWSSAWNRELLQDPYRKRLNSPPWWIYIVERFSYLIFFATVEPWFVLYPTILIAITVMQWVVSSMQSTNNHDHSYPESGRGLQTATGHCLLSAMNIVEIQLVQYYGGW